MSTVPNLFSLFGGRQRAVEQALRQSGQRQMQGAANAVAAGTARSNVNPMAAARVRNQSMVEERNAMAGREAQLRAQADMQQQQDISSLIGGGIGIAGTALGSMIGGPAGGAAGSALGGAASQALTGTLAGQDQARSQALGTPMAQRPAPQVPRAMGASQPPQVPAGNLGASGQLGNPSPQVMSPLAIPQNPFASRDPGAPNPGAAQAVNSLSRGQFDPTDILRRLMGL